MFIFSREGQIDAWAFWSDIWNQLEGMGSTARFGSSDLTSFRL